MKVRPTDPSALVIPFGKHKGSTVAEILVRDPSYADWIVAQGWVAERFAELHAAILTRGAGSDDTPEHNALQARFLDDEFRTALLLAALGPALAKTRNEKRETVQRDIEVDLQEIARRVRFMGSRFEQGEHESDESWKIRSENRRNSEDDNAQAKKDLEIEIIRYQTAPCWLSSQIKFEIRGVDVMVGYSQFIGGSPPLSGMWQVTSEVGVELKPTMGDDYPSVMRQMARLGVTILVIGEYTGRGAPAPIMRQMFEANGKTVLFVRDIESEMANARRVIAEGFPP